jgi:lambda family phage portal protein
MNEIFSLDLSEAKLAVMDSRATTQAATLARTAAESRKRDLNFRAGRVTRTTEDWGTSNSSADLDLWANLYGLRGRARRLSTNNPIIRKYLRMCQKNIAGDKGIQLQMKVPMKKGKKINKKLSMEIEAAWKRWTAREFCTVTGKMSFAEAQRFAIEQWKRDGECLCRMVTYDRGNPYNFALQFFDPDQLDLNYFMYQMPNGNQIRMSVETDAYGKPVNFHLWKRHPAEYSTAPQFRVVVPAQEMVHLFFAQRVGQTRGYPEMAPSMIGIHMIGKYSESEVIAARTAAEKQGFFESAAATDESYTGPRDEENMLSMKSEPGMLEQLPAGVQFKAWDANHPTQAFPFFMKSLTRLAGAGLDVSYESLANDREGVNYSSIRAGLLDERDTWRVEQDVFKAGFMRPIFEAWLQNAWLAGEIKLDGLPSDYFEFASFHARGWPWVDPLKDAQSAVLQVENGYEAQSDQMAEAGHDFESTIDRIKYEQDYILASGVKLGTDTKGIADTATDTEADEAAADSGGKKPETGGN